MQQQELGTPRRRARIVLWLVAVVALVAIVGAYATWRAGAPERWAELDREWALVVEGAQPLCPDDPELDAELVRLLDRAEGLGVSELGERLEGSGRVDYHDIGPLPPDLLEVLERIEVELDAGRVRMDFPAGEDGGTHRLIPCFRLLANLETADGKRIGRLLGCARRFQREGGLLAFIFGEMFTRELLDRIEGDPILLPVLASVEPPRPEELYAAMLRDGVLMTTRADPELGGAHWAVPSAELSGPARTGRREVVAAAQRYRALAAAPARFRTVEEQAKPGPLATFFRDLFPNSDAASPGFAPTMGFYGTAFAESIERWQRLVERR